MIRFWSCAVAILVCGTTALSPGSVRAEPPPATVQLALLNPLQAIDEERSITALRVSLLHGANHDVRGLDLGAVTSTTGTLRGLQLAGANEVDGGCTGMQVAVLVNYVEGRLSGGQLAGVAAYAGEGEGAQVATFLARAGKLHGLQIALVTVAEEMNGLQLGLLNFNKRGFLPVFPIFNFGR